MKTTTYDKPWLHYITDDFLSTDCLVELKSVKHNVPQNVYGRRVGSDRLFISDVNKTIYPNLYDLYISLHNGVYKEFFEDITQKSYSDLYPRVEVISDIGPFHLDMHHDHLEKKLSAIVYTDYEQLYPGTELSNNYIVESQDNRCFFFNPSTDTYHGYNHTVFEKVRRCLQINFWTYQV